MNLLDLKPDSAVEIAHAIRNDCVPLPDPGHALEFAPYFEPFAQARIVLLGEDPTALQLCGAALILAGLVSLAAGRRAQSPAAS